MIAKGVHQWLVGASAVQVFLMRLRPAPWLFLCTMSLPIHLAANMIVLGAQSENHPVGGMAPAPMARSAAQSSSSPKKGNDGSAGPQSVFGQIFALPESDMPLFPIHGEYRANWLLDEGQDHNSTFGCVRPGLSLDHLLWQTSGKEWLASATVRNRAIPSSGVGDRTPIIPDDLWNVRLTTTYRQHFGNGWISGASLSAMSVSQKPTTSFDDIRTTVDVFLMVPRREHASWIFGLNWSDKGNRPVSRVQYIWQRSTHLRATFGILYPISEPLEKLSLDLSVYFEH